MTSGDFLLLGPLLEPAVILLLVRGRGLLRPAFGCQTSPNPRSRYRDLAVVGTGLAVLDSAFLWQDKRGYCGPKLEISR